jgi:hypothetical protein
MVLSGPIHAAAGETWQAVEAALQKGYRGLPSGPSLGQLLLARRGVLNQRVRFSAKQILLWADAHRERTDSPGGDSVYQLLVQCGRRR